ncbi:hypothetical protein A3I95_02085 [Candidatus Nomurabacteria bacterium RIFCSPLOWO2_02_FULL_44_12]|uniref:Uncharacterized protein n=1 Tax=Candidatus Nomurabacteria bacterium RIFCSPLOWO2_12_FULL_44_11 TaxID=1801796 RepID=A0A1F6Y5V6_9BACT|nr:MAG: hypothetical protein A3E95_01925 [Candidatus Nomurabacteria bacterium RIFCSPHIGHO2_12_FULL_44_22b]OGJ01767.1 MAG: hypothetical protein A3G53_00960 [Candidatus Nomurabacteria bacterium RIFCSPLOWO2_12_FULL_44_11]OGJ07281.1 MAG: hypothetical protein A3I95_02085 [Candidatus Nomurabacteria bacterium RIFCSPLOWO2_02_FULL_44_12]
METDTGHKLNPLYVLIVVVVLGGLAYLLIVFKINTPYQVITPDNYPEGAKISLYQGLPPGFPSDVILEDKELDYSGSVKSADGRTRTTVSYISDSTLSNLVEIYQTSLRANGWEVSVLASSPKMAIIKVLKGQKQVLISLAPLQDKVMLTFRYEN